MAYYIITHLRDPDIFRKALSFHPSVFHSDAVENALEFVLAERQNNYARFFRLIRSSDTSYLSAGLLQQHFSHIRKNALYSMHAVYSMGQGQTVPLSDLVRILGFEGTSEAIDFFTHFGLSLNPPS